MPIYFLSEPQTKEVRDLFDFLDTDRDGLLSVEQALSLCRQLGFHVNKATLDLHGSHVNVRDLIGWCEAFVARCAHSEELHRTQMFMLLRRGDMDGITCEGLQRYLAEEKLNFGPEQAAHRLGARCLLHARVW